MYVVHAAKVYLDPVIPSWLIARMAERAKYHEIVTTALVCQHVNFFGNFLTVEATHHFCLVECDEIIKNEMVN